VGAFTFGDRKSNGRSRSIFRHLRRLVVGPIEQAIQIKFRNNLTGSWLWALNLVLISYPRTLADLPLQFCLEECIRDNVLIENPMEDRGIEMRLSVPVRRIALQIALDEY
jgi:hypothetical protein